MRLERLLTPAIVLVIGGLVIALPAERSGSVIGTISFLTGFGTTVAIYAVLVLGLNVQWGYTGVFNFGVAAFFMVGAYTAAIFTKPPADSEFVRYIGGFGDALSPPFLDSGQWLPFLVAVVVAGTMSGTLALLLSIPTLRLREDYLAIATIGIAELLRRVTIEEDGLVNSNRGLIGIPRPFYDYFDPPDYKYVYLAIAVAVLLLIFVAAERGIRSPWGRVLRALKEDEQVVAASGKNVFAFKMQGFVLGAVIMGVGGAIFAFSRGSVGPDTFDHFFATFLFWAMLIVGGSGNNRGAVVGVFVVWGIWTVTLQLNGYDLPDLVQSRIFYMRDFLIGALIVVFLLLRPQGLVPEERRVSIWLDRELRRQRRGEGQAKARA
jgi:branched-chain amino acid transport system permease protein